jgi:K+-sensing histidine kinase KdpD
MEAEFSNLKKGRPSHMVKKKCDTERRDEAPMADTYFAPAARAAPQMLQRDKSFISNNPIIDTLLHSVNGLLAVLNEQRQILTVNDSFLKLLNLDNPRNLLSLRPGEAVRCIHAHEAPNGCGTTKFCATCGAAISMVSCLADNMPVERTCSITVSHGQKTVELSLAVRAHPLALNGKRYILLFLQDISKEQFLVSIERTFFHDINNILCVLLGNCQLYGLKHDNPAEIERITNMVQRVSQEINIQKVLSNFGEAGLKPIRQIITSEDILDELMESLAGHPAAAGKTVTTCNNASGRTINTDLSLLLRVLCNMVINALEATKEQGEIKIRVDEQSGGLAIKVWNHSVIPEPIKLRIFQRYFSTKKGPGRGLGTYSMKVFGEQYLGGKVYFSSTEEEGTTFCLTL